MNKLAEMWHDFQQLAAEQVERDHGHYVWN